MTPVRSSSAVYTTVWAVQCFNENATVCSIIGVCRLCGI